MGEPSVEFLTQVLKNGDRDVLGKSLTNTLHHEDPGVRQKAAELSAVFGDETTGDALIGLLRDKYESVRKAAREALEKMGNKRFEEMRQRVSSIDEEYRESALSALFSIDEKYHELAIGIISWWRENAKQWWTTNKHPKAYCDSCDHETVIDRSKGFKQGNSLACIKCVHESLTKFIKWPEAIRDLRGWIGSDAPQYLIDMANRA
jgi:hypothetical protein